MSRFRTITVALFPLALGGCVGDTNDVSGVPGLTAPLEPTITGASLRLGGPAELVVSDQSSVRVELVWKYGERTVYPVVSWTSSDPRIVQLSPGVCFNCSQFATINAIAEGRATITATVAGVSASVTLSVTPLRAAQAVIWTGTTIVYLPMPPGYGASWAAALNDAGQVAGSVSISAAASIGAPDAPLAPTHAFLWEGTSGAVDLGVLPGDTASGALGISRSGSVVGWSASPSGRRRAFVWSRSAGMRALATPPDATGAEARGINANGEIAGVIYTLAGREPFYWSPDGTGARFETTAAGVQGEANAISEDGVAAGWVLERAGSNIHAVVWSNNSTPRQRILDPNPCEAYSYSYDGCAFAAVAISRNGAVALNSEEGNYVWIPSRGYLIVSPIAYAEYGATLASVNDDGDVAGNARLTVRQYRAFVCRAGSLPVILPLLDGRRVSVAAAINSFGLVAGYVQ